MISEGVVLLLCALLLLAPGLVWEVAVRRNRSTSSTVREVSGLLLASVGCTGAAIGVVALIRAITPTAVVDLGAWIRTDDYYFHRNYDIVLTTVLLTTALACVFAALLALVSSRTGAPAGRLGTDAVLPALLHAPIDASPAPPGAPRAVLVRTHEGTVYQGAFVAIDERADSRAPALALGGPIVFRRAGGEAESMPSAWDRLVLPMSDVAEFWLRSARSTAAPKHAVEPDPTAAPFEPDPGSTDGRRAEPSADAPHDRRRRRLRRAAVTPDAGAGAGRGTR